MLERNNFHTPCGLLLDKNVSEPNDGSVPIAEICIEVFKNKLLINSRHTNSVRFYRSYMDEMTSL